jgi:hypothetical protein
VPRPDIDLSFARYVAARKGEVAARTREGAAYAYAGDIKVRAALDRVRPVTLAVEATVRLWQSVEKARMLGTAVKVTAKQFPRISKLADTCAETLRIPVPTVYVSPNIGSLNAHTFGTADDPYIVLNAALIDHLSEPELLDVIGHECGHIQNSHVVYMTTLHFLKHAANMFLRWSVKPAVLALNGWARRAEITCDRAGMICTRDIDVSIGCLVKLAIGSQKLYSEVSIPEYLNQLKERRPAWALRRADAHASLSSQAGGGAAAVRGDDIFPQPGRHRARGGRAGGRAAAGHVEGRMRRARRPADLGAVMASSSDRWHRWTTRRRPSAPR